MSLLKMVKNKKVHFRFYRSQILFYETDDGFLFEVPIEDIGGAVFNRDDKAILFMRYIRKQIDVNNSAKSECYIEKGGGNG